jgi:hypothetical protein
MGKGEKKIKKKKKKTASEPLGLCSGQELLRLQSSVLAATVHHSLRDDEEEHSLRKKERLPSAYRAAIDWYSHPQHSFLERHPPPLSTPSP